MISTLLVRHLARRATARHGKGVQPAGTADTWRESITECDITNTITLWYNVRGDASTHTIIMSKESTIDDLEPSQDKKKRLSHGV